MSTLKVEVKYYLNTFSIRSFSAKLLASAAIPINILLLTSCDYSSLETSQDGTKSSTPTTAIASPQPAMPSPTPIQPTPPKSTATPAPTPTPTFSPPPLVGHPTPSPTASPQPPIWHGPVPTPGSNPSSTHEILNSNYNWSHFSGTSWDGKVLTVIPLDRKIRPKSDPNGKWYFNPPINLSGPRVDFSDSFSVTVTVDVGAQTSQAAFIDFYGTLPISYDEWRIDAKSVRFQVKQGTVNVSVNQAKQSFSFSGLTNSVVTLGLTKKGSTLTLSVNGNPTGNINETGNHVVFPNGKLYFGFDAELGGGFAVKSIQVPDGAIADNYSDFIKTYASSPTGLRSYASQVSSSLFIGTAANVDALFSDPMYGKTLAENFSIITPELHFKFQAIHPQPDQYSFAESDALADFAAKNNIKIHGHTLVWHEALPQWIWDLYTAKNSTNLRNALLDHIATVVTRYRSTIREWDTLNEIFSDESSEPYGLRSNAEQDNSVSIWYKTFGIQIYIDALRKVKEIDSGIENWVNDFSIDQASAADKLNNMVNFIKFVNNQGYGQLIDGIGFQAHNYDPDTDPSVASELLAAMQNVINQGIKVRISELDVEGASARPTLFSDKLDVCLTLLASGNCSAFSMWGFTDKYGSMSSPTTSGTTGDNITSPNWGAQYDDSLIFDENYVAKSPVSSMVKSLQNKLGSSKKMTLIDKSALLLKDLFR